MLCVCAGEGGMCISVCACLLGGGGGGMCVCVVPCQNIDLFYILFLTVHCRAHSL